MYPSFEFVWIFNHIRIFLFFTRFGRGSLLRTIYCKTHWWVMQHTTTKMGI